MFGIGVPELIIILIVALLVVGPSKLPELARSMGKALGEFRRLTDDVKQTIEQEMAKEPEKEEEPQKQVRYEETTQGQLFEQQAPDVGQAQEPLPEAPVIMGGMGDGHLVAEDVTEKEQLQQHKEEPALAQAEAGSESAPGTVPEQKQDSAEKIAEGIRVNDPQKT